VGFSVRATDPRFLDMVRPHLAALRVDAPAEHASMFSASVGEDRILPGGKRTRGLHNLFFGMLRIYRGPYVEEMGGRLLSAARDVITNGQDQFVRLRGGAVEVDGRAVLLISPSPEAHQAALTSLLARRGGRFIGEGVLELDPVLRRIHPSPLPPLLYEGDLDLFPGLPEQPVRRRKRDDPGRAVMLPPRPVTLESIGAARPEGPVPVGWIVFPRFDLDEETRLEPAGGAELLFRFTEAILNLHVWRDRSLVLLRELLEGTAVSHLAVGSMDDAADLLMRTAPGLMEGVST
jgi:hypothetical protein